MTVDAQPNIGRAHRRFRPDHARVSVHSALAAVICLAGFIGLPFWYGLLVYALPPPVNRTLEQFLPGDVLAHSWLQIAIVGGAAWGWWLARILAYPHTWRLVVTCGVGVGIGQVLATGQIQRFIHPLLAGAPFHIWFAVQFVLGIGAVVITTGGALGIALQSWRVAATLALVGRFAAAAPAGAVLVLLDGLGMRVGAGHANMAKVMVLGFLAATLSGGALFGWVLARHLAPLPPDSRELSSRAADRDANPEPP